MVYASIIFILFTDAENSDFLIESDTGIVKIKNLIDRDVSDFDLSFELIITATCRNYPDNLSTTTRTVFIQDINDNLPDFDLAVYDCTVNENTLGRLYEIDIKVSDPDLKDFGMYTVEIQGQPANIQLNPPDGRNNATFFLSISNSEFLDYEDPRKRNVTLTLVATEKDPAGRSTTATVNIWSADVNDNSPVFLSLTHPDDGSYEVTIPENSPISSAVITILTEDLDVSPQFGSDSVRLTFVEDFDASRYFKLNDINGQVDVAGVIDRESISANPLTYNVQAIDMCKTFHHFTNFLREDHFLNLLTQMEI